jgi:hypothetical protein
MPAMTGSHRQPRLAPMSDCRSSRTPRPCSLCHQHRLDPLITWYESCFPIPLLLDVRLHALHDLPWPNPPAAPRHHCRKPPRTSIKFLSSSQSPGRRQVLHCRRRPPEAPHREDLVPKHLTDELSPVSSSPYHFQPHDLNPTGKIRSLTDSVRIDPSRQTFFNPTASVPNLPEVVSLNRRAPRVATTLF